MLDQEARAERTDLTLSAAHNEGARPVRCHLDHEGALVQVQQAMLGGGGEIGGAAGVQVQLAAISQGEMASFAGAGAQACHQRLAWLAAAAEPEPATEQADADQAAQQVAAAWFVLQQALAQGLGARLTMS